MDKKEIISVVLIIISFLIGIYFYFSMPEKMASHWNARGEVDGYVSKFWGLFLMPLVLTGSYALFKTIPKIDPLKKNIMKFKPYYDGFVILFVGFMFYIYLVTLVANLGFGFNMTFLIVPAVSILFYYCGVLMQHAKRNWFIGIRTPWTLSSDEVWEKTHKLGSKFFKVFAVVFLIGIVFPDFFLYIILISLLVGVFSLIAYSYFEYEKVKRR